MFLHLSYSAIQYLSFYPMNPFREDLVARSLAEPCTVVIFGATGDLTHRKLIPRFYNLAVDGELPTGVKIIGFARREKSDAEFRAGLAEINRKVSRSGHDERVWNPFIETRPYHQSEFTDAGRLPQPRGETRRHRRRARRQGQPPVLHRLRSGVLR